MKFPWSKIEKTKEEQELERLEMQRGKKLDENDVSRSKIEKTKAEKAIRKMMLVEFAQGCITQEQIDKIYHECFHSQINKV